MSLTPKTDRLVAQVSGGGWRAIAFDPSARILLLSNYISVERTELWLLDLMSLEVKPLGDHTKMISYSGGEFSPDGKLWLLSDESSDFKKLGTLDLKSGKFSPKNPETKWDVTGFDISPDGRFLVYEMNEAGQSALKIMNLKTNKIREIKSLPAGVINSFEVSPWGDIGLSLSSAVSPSDVYVVNARSLLATRWTQSETGGLNPEANVHPSIVTVKSFDGEEVSGFLYHPDPKRFPGKRPLIVTIHGGPEAQWRPAFLGRTNYLINELGIAVFAPNVRGSTGFGKRFVNLDNGPFKREDSVKDIGAFLEVLEKNPRVEASKMGVAGGSYGGYMCYASAIFYPGRLKSAICTVAISNFVTFLENTQGYRRDLRRVEYGDERDLVQRRKLLEISPITRAREIKIPMMVVTGANDPRVPKSEADQMVDEVRKLGGLAWHLVGTNEGHGFAKKENIDYQFWAMLLFWKETLLTK